MNRHGSLCPHTPLHQEGKGLGEPAWTRASSATFGGRSVEAGQGGISGVGGPEDSSDTLRLRSSAEELLETEFPKLILS